MKKFFLNIKNIIILLIRNKYRTLLLILGLIITSVAFSAGAIITSNIAFSTSVKYQNFPSNSILLKGSVNKKTIEQIHNFDTQLKVTSCWINMGNNLLLLNKDKTLPVKFYNVCLNYFDYPIISADTEDSLEKTALIAGRNFNNDDFLLNRSVVIIHNSVAQMLFSDGNVLGKKIRVDATSYTVVGVIKDTPDVKRIVKDIDNGANRALPLYVPCFMEYYNYAICLAPEEVTQDYAAKLVKYIEEKNLGTYLSSYTMELHNKELSENMRDAKAGLNVLLAVMYVICTIFILAIMLFFVKERVVEIGIRKAVGAQPKDITFQFMFEMFIISLVSSIVGTIIGTFLGLMISYLLTASIGMISIQIQLSSIFLPILVSVLIALLAGFIPSVIASKLTIKECLQFD